MWVCDLKKTKTFKYEVFKKLIAHLFSNIMDKLYLTVKFKDHQIEYVFKFVFTEVEHI